MEKTWNISGRQYEHICADKLKRCGFVDVRVTRGSGDQGIDVIAYKNGKKYGIQCKYYSESVGNSAVQEVYAGAKYYGCDIAVVMTNSTFTKSAKELAEKTNVLLWDNGKIPFNTTVSKFRVTKLVGIIMCIVSGLFLLTSIAQSIEIRHITIQRILWGCVFIGGFFNICDLGSWYLSAIACFFYILATALSIFVDILFWSFSKNVVFILFCFFISLVRTVQLYKSG